MSIITGSHHWILFQCLTATLILLLLFHERNYFFTTGKNNGPIKNEYNKAPYTIITGSSANHLCSLENFLYSLHSFRSELQDQFPKIVVYNIGMNRTQLPVLAQLENNQLIDQVIHFDHERYPQFWDVAVEAGQYAWKTGIVNDARIRYGGMIVWLDAGNQVSKDFLLNVPNIIKTHHGFWSPKSPYGMGKWTHPGMFRYFNVDSKPYKYKSNCNGAAIGFDTENKTIVDTLIVPWFECGLVKNCIAPPGSNRENHRQDQAALTFLAYFNGHQCSVSPRDYHLQIHRDQACRSNLMELDLQNQLYHPSSIDYPKWEREDTMNLYNHPEWKYPSNHIPVN